MPVNDLLTRLSASADYLAALHDTRKAETERRDGLIVELRDLGVSWSAIAKAARLGMTRCTSIVNSAPGPLDAGYHPEAV